MTPAEQLRQAVERHLGEPEFGMTWTGETYVFDAPLGGGVTMRILDLKTCWAVTAVVEGVDGVAYKGRPNAKAGGYQTFDRMFLATQKGQWDLSRIELVPA